jgi:hypothetical protein
MRQIQAMFRRIFVRWGRPDQIRVDNGYPWGSSGDMPSELALWLIGLGVGLIWNPPAQPRCNPKVERSNGLTQQWGEPQTCSNLRQLAKVLAEVGRIQREEYPALRGQTRMDVFPQLRTPRRVYRRSDESGLWELSRVDAFLAQGSWQRRASRTGVISIYGHNRAVGRTWAQQELGVRFDPTSRCWVISDQSGEVIKQLPAHELTKQRIMTLAVSRRRKK